MSAHFNAETGSRSSPKRGHSRRPLSGTAIAPLTCAGFTGSRRRSFSIGSAASTCRMLSRRMFGLVLVRRNAKETFYRRQFHSTCLSDHAIRRVECRLCFHFTYRRWTASLAGAGEPASRTSASRPSAYLAALKASPEDMFYHALAILHAPAYRTENAGACARTGRGFRCRRRRIRCSPPPPLGGRWRPCWTRKRLFPA